MPVEQYKDFLYKQLQDPEYAAEYLNACLEESPDVFLLGLKDVVESCGGISVISERSQINYETLCKLLSKNGNPKMSNLQSILDAVGFRLRVGVKSS